MEKILAALLSFIFPPLGVLLRRGVGAHLAVNVLLTLALWLPGLCHALYLCVVDDVANPDSPAHGQPIEPLK